MGQEISKVKQLQAIYKTSSDSVRRKSLTEEDSETKYKSYFEFVNNFTSTGKLLDIGCGSGWSTHLFSKKGYHATGVDLHEGKYEPKQNSNLVFQSSSVENLTFQDSTFDIVCTNECLEHVPNPEQALKEMNRVLKPGGFLIIVGPNLLSVGMSIRALTKYVWQNRPVYRIFFRDKEMQKHPFGNTLFEVLFFFIRNLILITYKMLTPKPTYSLREPDLIPPFHADNDACYLLNPIDLKKFAKENSNIELIRSGALKRPMMLEMISAGTWICLKKIN